MSDMNKTIDFFSDTCEKRIYLLF